MSLSFWWAHCAQRVRMEPEDLPKMKWQMKLCFSHGDRYWARTYIVKLLHILGTHMYKTILMYQSWSRYRSMDFVPFYFTWPGKWGGGWGRPQCLTGAPGGPVHVSAGFLSVLNSSSLCARLLGQASGSSWQTTDWTPPETGDSELLAVKHTETECTQLNLQDKCTNVMMLSVSVFISEFQLSSQDTMG